MFSLPILLVLMPQMLPRENLFKYWRKREIEPNRSTFVSIDNESLKAISDGYDYGPAWIEYIWNSTWKSFKIMFCISRSYLKLID